MAARTLALVAMCLVAFFSYLAVGMIAPFLPQHLKAMGVSERWSGIIFAVYSVAMIAVTPLCNKLVAQHGRMPLIAVGLFAQAVSTFAFGRFGDSLAVLLISRALQGCGASASNLAIFALVADIFEDSIGRVMGLSEVVIGAGFSIGPLVGALLYAQGGFAMPFIVCSVILAVTAALIPVLLGFKGSASSAKPDGKTPAAADEGSAVGRLWAACTLRLLAPAGLLLQGCMIWGVVDSGFYTVHAANELGLEQTAIGVNLAAASAAYSAVGLLAGTVADSIGYGPTMLGGSLVSATSLLLLGPAAPLASQALADFYHNHDVVEVQRWYEFSILVLMGCGQAFTLVPSLGAMKSSVTSGDASATEACVSLFNTFQQAGLVLGPLASSALGAHYALGNTGIAAVLLLYSTLMSPQLRRPAGKKLGEPLLGQAPASPMVSPVSPMAMHMTAPDRRVSGAETPPSKLVI